jgi:arylsulfatase A-like enzyme
VLLAAALGSGAIACGEPPPQHVVLIVLDTLRADRLGCYGFPLATSPEIDRLADRGVRFARTLAQAPWTRPSVGSLVTSLHPRTLGLYLEWGDMLNDRFVTLAEVLQAHGYRTLGATANANLNSVFNFHQGFDHYVDSHVVWNWMKPKPGETRARRAALPSAPERFGEILAALDDEEPEEREKPHYVQVNVMEIHESAKPDVVRREFAGLFAGRRDADYLRAIRQLSRDLDAFVRALSARPGWQRVLWVITSDHGEGLFDHPRVPRSEGHGFLLYESQVVVPLILYDTAGHLPAGRVVERPVRLLDLMPTILDHLGIEGPAGMAGRSLLPLLRGDEVDLPDDFVVETRFRGSRKIGVYARDWKLIENRDGHEHTRLRALHPLGGGENGRSTDVGHRHPEVVERLAARLAAWEHAHPRMSPTHPDRDLSESEVEQLRALGYVP